MLAALLLSWNAEASEVRGEATGLLHTWLTAYDQDDDPVADPAGYGDPEHDMGLTLQRARLGLVLELPDPPKLTGTTVWMTTVVGSDAPADALDTASSDIALIDARLGFDQDIGRYHNRTAVGFQRIQYSRESMIASADLVFQDRSIGATHLVPSRSVGVSAAPSLDWGKGETPVRTTLRFGAFDATSELFDSSGGGGLAFGRLDVGWGEDHATWSADGDSALGAGASLVGHDVVGATDLTWHVDLLARWRWVTALGGLTRSTVRPADGLLVNPLVNLETERTATWAQLGGFIPCSGDQGLEIAARYELFDDAGHLEDNGDVSRLTAGLTWRNLVPFVDMGAGYVHREELHGNAFDNDTLRIWIGARPKVGFGG